MFEVAKCLTCPASTQHRCAFPMPIGKYFDVNYGMRICGQAICNLCLRENQKRHRCKFHQNFNVLLGIVVKLELNSIH